MRQPFEYHDRGAAALGEELPLGCRTVNGSGTPTAPDACPTMKVIDSTGTVLVSHQIPVQDKYGATGLFREKLLLDSTFAAGRYWVTYDWTTGSGAYVGAALDTFEVLPGGAADGEVIALYGFNRPHGNHVLGQTNSGELLLARNPKV